MSTDGNQSYSINQDGSFKTILSCLQSYIYLNLSHYDSQCYIPFVGVKHTIIITKCTCTLVSNIVVNSKSEYRSKVQRYTQVYMVFFLCRSQSRHHIFIRAQFNDPLFGAINISYLCRYFLKIVFSGSRRTIKRCRVEICQGHNGFCPSYCKF